jgi:hypothetical protein
MIDNFEKIGSLISGKASSDEFYFLQILKRRKDNPDLKKDMILIDNFFIKGEEDLYAKKDRIVELCTINNARAYFRLNKRSYERVALETLSLIAKNIAAHNYDIKNCYLSCCGQYHSDSDKTWIVDIDDSKEASPLMMAYIEHELQPFGETKIIATIPTKNGIHIVTRPFRLDLFKQKYPGVDVHKENPTILYIP